MVKLYIIIREINSAEGPSSRMKDYKRNSPCGTWPLSFVTGRWPGWLGSPWTSSSSSCSLYRIPRSSPLSLFLFPLRCPIGRLSIFRTSLSPVYRRWWIMALTCPVHGKRQPSWSGKWTKKRRWRGWRILRERESEMWRKGDGSQAASAVHTTSSIRTHAKPNRWMWALPWLYLWLKDHMEKIELDLFTWLIARHCYSSKVEWFVAILFQDLLLNFNTSL